VAIALVIASPPRLRAVVALAGGGFALAVNVALLTEGWHYPSDVVAAALVAFAVAEAVGPCAGGRRPALARVAVTAAAIALTGAALALMVARSGGTVAGTSADVAFGSAAIVAATAGVLAAHATGATR